MKLYKNMAVLLRVATAVSDDQVGDTYRVETSSEDGVHDHDQDYQFYFKATQSGGASSPTSQIKVQTSPDGENWVDLVESTELTAEGTKVETKSTTTLPLLKFVRAITSLGGGTKPHLACEVRLVSTAPFRARKAS